MQSPEAGRKWEVPDQPRLELFLRSLAPFDARDQQERIIDTLESLSEAGRVKEFRAHVCGESLSPTSAPARTEVGQHLLDRYEAFRDWARTHDRELVGFTERSTTSLVTDTTTTEIVLPQIVLAEYHDGDLTYVAPSSNGADTTSVADRLDIY